MNEVKNTEDLTLSAPWIEYHNQIYALFDEDPNVSVVYDDDEKVIKLFVDGTDKADALTKLLPTEKNFGGVTVKVMVIPANKTETVTELLATAFEGNPNFVEIVESQSRYGEPPFTYCVFAPRVAQYWNDNLHDLHGNTSTLYENLARDVIGEQIGVCFCTDELIKDAEE